MNTTPAIPLLADHDVAGVKYLRNVVVFYAWQGDRPNNVNRGLIEKALADAAAKFNASSADVKIAIDQDTQGVPGTPPVSQTILDKIARCDIFLPDLTFVAKFDEGKKAGRPAPNPNVLIEYGFALHAKGHNAMMPIMNLAFGEPEDLPFDMKHLRHPIQYSANPDSDPTERAVVRERLSNDILSALKATVQNLPTQADQSKITKALREKVQEFHSLQTNVFQQLIPVQLVAGPKLLLHIFPLTAAEENHEIDYSAVEPNRSRFLPFDYTSQISRPDSDDWMFHDMPALDRRGMFPGRFEPQPNQCMWFCKISRFGVIELISMIDSIGMPNDKGPIAIDGTMLEALIVHTLERLVAGLSNLGVSPPAIIRASLLEVRGIVLLQGIRPGGQITRQPIQLPEIVLEDFTAPLARSLKPLIDAIYRSAGISSGTQSFAAGEWAGYEHR